MINLNWLSISWLLSLFHKWFILIELIVVVADELGIHNFFKSVVESFVTMLWATVIEIHIDGKAHERSKDSIVEKTEGDEADEPVENYDEDSWTNEIDVGIIYFNEAVKDNS